MRRACKMIPGITGEVVVSTEYVAKKTYLDFETYFHNDMGSYLEYPLNEYDEETLESVRYKMPKHLHTLISRAVKNGSELLWIKVRK